MNRTERIDTVLRVRHLQARQAEIETVQRRLESERRRAARSASVDRLAERSTAQIGTIDTADGLQRNADLLRIAVGHIEVEGELLAEAEVATREAEAAWLAAHRREDAVERLAERHHAAVRDEATRREQKELDDLVSVRHGRPGAQP